MRKFVTAVSAKVAAVPASYRNACILALGAASSSAHADADLSAAAAAALDAAQSDVTATAPKVLLVVATVVSVGILISLVRKA